MSAKKLSRGERDLLLFLLAQLSDKMGAAGCNDMDQSVIDAMDPVDRLNIHRDFNAWDQTSNPDGWEARKLDYVPDFLWVAYLQAKIKGDSK